MRIITLLTDFGNVDGYVAQMKAAVLRMVPDVEIIDISHGIKPHNIVMGSFVLETTAPYFPIGTIHVAVVDPGVGGSRLPIMIVCKNGILVGPDNGLLARASDKLTFIAAYRIKTGNFTGNISSTFHGRDIFAITAAKIVAGKRPSQLGSKIRRITRLQIPEARISAGKVSCHAIHVDSFGNIVTNIRDDNRIILTGKTSTIARLNRKGHSKHPILLVSSYHEIRKGQIGLLRGSQGYYEIAAREASAADLLAVQDLDELSITFTRSYRSRKYRGGVRPRQPS